MGHEKELIGLTGARPTLYVLKECLKNPDDWGDPEQYRAVRKNDFKKLGKLNHIDHPVMRAASHLNLDPASADSQVIYEHALHVGMPSLWRELRQGQWRGLLTAIEDIPPWWILFAGLRRSGDYSNVYSKIDAMDKDALESLYPSERDLTLQKLENSLAIQENWEGECANIVLSSLAEAVRTEKITSGTIPRHPTRAGAELNFEFHVERTGSPESPREVPADIFLELRTKNWSDSVLRDVVVPIMVGVIDPVQEHWEVVEDRGREVIYLVQTTEVKIQQILAAEAFSDAGKVVSNTAPSYPSTKFAHFSKKRALTDAYIYGNVSEAVCGFSFVPSKDVSELPVCPECNEIYQRLNE